VLDFIDKVHTKYLSSRGTCNINGVVQYN